MDFFFWNFYRVRIEYNLNGWKKSLKMVIQWGSNLLNCILPSVFIMKKFIEVLVHKINWKFIIDRKSLLIENWWGWLGTLSFPQLKYSKWTKKRKVETWIRMNFIFQYFFQKHFHIHPAFFISCRIVFNRDTEFFSIGCRFRVTESMYSTGIRNKLVIYF